MAPGAQTCPTPAPAREASCEYRFKNPSLGKTLMINQAADPSAAAGSGRGARGRAGARRHGVAFRASEESRSRRRRAGRALAACSRGRTGASVRGRRRRRAGHGGRGLCRLRSPDVRRRRPRPERAAWGPRWPRRWAPSTIWHFSCNSVAPRGPRAMRPGTTTSLDTVSLRAAPTDFPTEPHPGRRRSNSWRLQGSNPQPQRPRHGVPRRPLLGLGTHPGPHPSQCCEEVPRAQPRSRPSSWRTPTTTRAHSRADTHTSATIQMSPAADTLSHAHCIPHSQLRTPPLSLSTLVDTLVPTMHTHQTLAGGSPCQLAPRHTCFASPQLLPVCLQTRIHIHTHTLVHTLCPPTLLSPGPFLLCGVNAEAVLEPFIWIHPFRRWEWS